MKNLLLLGFTALSLFTISAALSVFLQQSKKTDAAATAALEEAKQKEKEKEKEADSHDKKTEKDKGKAIDPDKKAEGKAAPPSVTKDSPTTVKAASEQTAALEAREARLDKQKEQIEIVLADIRSEREALDGLSKQVSMELKAALARANDIEQKTTEAPKATQDNTKAIEDLKKQKLEVERAEELNIKKLGKISEGMPAETSAKMLQNLADTGKMDTAVKLLAAMSDRQAARVLSEIQDTGLASQLVEKMRTLKRSTPVAPAPGS